ncbi:MAG: hypothetical protein J6J33_02240, partial [Clostridia bacterium]|nr:hypothetical protein [Clostridia bacterium]
MARIINFVGNNAANSGQLIFEISKLISTKNKVCIFDMDFGVNQTVCLFDNFPKYDLKDCLIGDKRFEDVLCTSYKNLQLVKCNNVFFDYLKYKEEIKKIIKNIEVDFDYIFIVGFNYDELKFEFRSSISTEIIFVADNSV